MLYLTIPLADITIPLGAIPLENTGCTFSIIIPVLHEELRINSLIEKLYRQFSGESFEIIVVDGDVNGSTVREIQHPNITAACSASGRGRQMNTGAKLARGEILLFLHADTELPANAFQHIRKVLSDERYAAGAFKLRWDGDSWKFKLLETTASWRYLLTRLPYGDQAFFMRKEYFFRIGCFQELPIMEDLELMRRIKGRGDKVHISRTSHVITSARRWKKEGIMYSVLRTWTLASLYCLGVSPYTLVKYYRAPSDD